ncbi:MAG: DUF819 family protein [Bacteroidales bacterium]|nr:DUF819 family protein [Bacteroidales bacterium]
MGIAIILFYFIFPAVVLLLSTMYTVIQRIGVVVICYLAGLILGNAGIVPESISGFQGNLMGVSILLGIPLVLFSENIFRWAKMAKNTFLSLILGIVSVVIMVIVGHLLLRERIPEIWKISGMLIGLYTGGTPNLAAIAQGLNVDEELYILTHTVDLAIGVVVLIFLLTGAQRFFRMYMRPYKSAGNHSEEDTAKTLDEFESYRGFFARKTLRDLIKSFGLAILIFGAGYGMTLFFEGETKDTAGILTVTTLGILLSMVPSVNKLKKSFQLGMYFIYVFSVVVASKANLRELFQPESWTVVWNITFYILLAVPGSLILHSLLSWIFRVNTDDFIITSTALSMSPPFVPVVAAALKNKEVMVSGMIIGVIGYAIGNYLGVAIAYLLK